MLGRRSPGRTHLFGENRQKMGMSETKPQNSVQMSIFARHMLMEPDSKLFYNLQPGGNSHCRSRGVISSDKQGRMSSRSLPLTIHVNFCLDEIGPLFSFPDPGNSDRNLETQRSGRRGLSAAEVWTRCGDGQETSFTPTTATYVSRSRL